MGSVSEHGCPRCGYDLRGPVETWSDRCPLRGDCAECGLPFHWASVLVPHKFEPRWSFEFAARRDLLRTFRQTVVHALWPWTFWRSMNLSNRFRPGRLVAFFLLLALLVFSFFAIEQTAVAWRVRDGQVTAIAGAQLSPAEAKVNIDVFQRRLDQHPGLPEAHKDYYRQQIALIQAAVANPPTLHHSAAASAIEASFRPLGRTSSGFIFSRGARMSYPPPVSLHSRYFSSLLNRPPFGARFCTSAVFALGIFVLTPLTFVLLPITRRRARVRWSHVLRVAVYSVVPAGFVFSVFLILVAIAAAIDSSGSRIPEVGRVAFPWATPLLTWLWWWAAASQYMRLPRGALVALALTALSAMTVLLIMTFVAKGMSLELYSAFYD